MVEDSYDLPSITVPLSDWNRHLFNLVKYLNQTTRTRAYFDIETNKFTCIGQLGASLAVYDVISST
jgi:hypothetical protein